MGYADTVMLLRDADSDTEIEIERLDGSSDDGAVIELRVQCGYAGRATGPSGYVRLTAQYLHALSEYIGAHAEHLRTVEWAEQSWAAQAKAESSEPGSEEGA